MDYKHHQILWWNEMTGCNNCNNALTHFMHLSTKIGMQLPQVISENIRREIILQSWRWSFNAIPGCFKPKCLSWHTHLECMFKWAYHEDWLIWGKNIQNAKQQYKQSNHHRFLGANSTWCDPNQSLEEHPKQLSISSTRSWNLNVVYTRSRPVWVCRI
jgi:hypothetical protein